MIVVVVRMADERLSSSLSVGFINNVKSLDLCLVTKDSGNTAGEDVDDKMVESPISDGASDVTLLIVEPESVEDDNNLLFNWDDNFSLVFRG